ncbi:MAG: hypothetical protein V3S30_01915 [Thermoanaerobaculia bacterium]
MNTKGSPEIAGKPPSAEIAKEIGELLALAGQLFQNDQGAQACQVLKRVLELDPGNLLVQRLLGRVNDRIRKLLVGGETDKAETLLAKVETSIGLDEAGGRLRRDIDAKRSEEVRSELLLREANRFSEEGSLDRARDSLRRVLEVDPHHQVAAALLAKNKTAIKRRDETPQKPDVPVEEPTKEFAGQPAVVDPLERVEEVESDAAAAYVRVPAEILDSQQVSEYSSRRSWLVYLIIGVIVAGGGATWLATRGGNKAVGVEPGRLLRTPGEASTEAAVPTKGPSSDSVTEETSERESFDERRIVQLPHLGAEVPTEMSPSAEESGGEVAPFEESEEAGGPQVTDLGILDDRSDPLVRTRRYNQTEQAAEHLEPPELIPGERRSTGQRRRAAAARQAFKLDRARLASLMEQMPTRFALALNLIRRAESKVNQGDFDGARSDFEAASRSALKAEREIAQDAARARSGLNRARQAMETARSQAPLGVDSKAATESAKAEKLQREGKIQDATLAYQRAAALYGSAGQRRDQDRDGILATLKRYEAAMESQDLKALRRIWPSLQGTKARRISQSFKYTRSLSLTLEYLDFQVSNDTASVICQRHDRMVSVQGQEITNDMTQTFHLRRSGSTWVIEGISQ